MVVVLEKRTISVGKGLVIECSEILTMLSLKMVNRICRIGLT